MKLNEYQQLALRTAPADVSPGHDLVHAGYGFASESGEFLDVLKKQHAYGKPLDLVNLKEEVGDLLWYAAIACRGLGITLEEAAATNIAKLAKRYPERFTAEAALNRDLAGERAVLEGQEWNEGMYEGVKPTFLPPAEKPARETRYTLGTGMILEQRDTRWVVIQATRIVAQTEPGGRRLILTDDASEGSWFFAAQQTLNTALSHP